MVAQAAAGVGFAKNEVADCSITEEWGYLLTGLELIDAGAFAG